jgi:hypothetical protein
MEVPDRLGLFFQLLQLKKLKFKMMSSLLCDDAFDVLLSSVVFKHRYHHLVLTMITEVTCLINSLMYSVNLLSVLSLAIL